MPQMVDCSCRTPADECNHPALLLIDGVSSVGAIPFKMDEWRVDVALTGSQKALSMPTGLGIVCAGPRALEAAKHRWAPMMHLLKGRVQ